MKTVNQLSAAAPHSYVMLLAPQRHSGKVLCACQVPKVMMTHLFITSKGAGLYLKLLSPHRTPQRCWHLIGRGLCVVTLAELLGAPCWLPREQGVAATSRRLWSGRRSLLAWKHSGDDVLEGGGRDFLLPVGMLMLPQYFYTSSMLMVSFLNWQYARSRHMTVDHIKRYR